MYAPAPVQHVLPIINNLCRHNKWRREVIGILQRFIPQWGDAERDFARKPAPAQEL